MRATLWPYVARHENGMKKTVKVLHWRISHESMSLNLASRDSTKDRVINLPCESDDKYRKIAGQGAPIKN